MVSIRFVTQVSDLGRVPLATPPKPDTAQCPGPRRAWPASAWVSGRSAGVGPATGCVERGDRRDGAAWAVGVGAVADHDLRPAAGPTGGDLGDRSGTARPGPGMADRSTRLSDDERYCGGGHGPVAGQRAAGAPGSNGGGVVRRVDDLERRRGAGVC